MSRNVWNVTANPDPRERTVVSVPAQLRQVRVLRLVVAGSLSMHGFGIDMVEDVRSAVDESCALVLGGHGGTGRLSLSLECDSTGVTGVVRGSFAAIPERGPDENQLAERMLEVHVDHYDIDLVHHRVSFERLAGPGRFEMT